MKLSLARYEILGWKFFSLRMLNIGPHSLLACRVSAERSTLSLMGFPSWVTQSFSLAAFSIFSFILTLVNLTIMCLGVALLEEYLCCALCISWTWILACLARLGKFSWIISWRVCQLGFILSVTFRYTYQMQIRSFHIIPYFLEALFISFYSFFSNLAFSFYFIELIFNLWYPFFCLINSTVKMCILHEVLVLCFLAPSGHLYSSLSHLFSLAFHQNFFKVLSFFALG